MTSSSDTFSGNFQFEYQEEMLISTEGKTKISIGVPKEDHNKEKRIPLTPNTVQFLIDNNIQVLIESQAGIASGFSDMEYSDSGAEILDNKESVYKADIIIKIAPPSLSEISFLRKNQVLISSLNLKTLSKEYFLKLSERKITAIALEHIKDNIGGFPFIEFMSDIIGKVTINIISNFSMEKKGKLLGSIAGNKPVEVIIIGAGSVALSTAQAAINQGANIKIFDNSITRLKSLQQNIKQNIYTSILHLPLLQKEFLNADVVIGALSNYEEHNNFIISNDVIKKMKKGSLLIDLSIDQGICFESSKLTDFKKPFFEKFGITHYGIPNISSMASRTSSYVLGNIFTQLFSNFQNYGNINHFLKSDSNFRNGLYFYSGVLVNQHIGERFDLPTKDINLILAAF